ncbi:MAG TPA: wax ester/triacylglycerol synthase family O-acyltransferase [Burkholderiaceae bacterium]|nr:wax ester/triacylglycerol synthase family O-acyltransferase [Burkholderiaceae bacterium]
MKQLSGLDASFLYLETPEMPMHVGALHVFELPTGYKGRFVRDLRRHVARRLPMLPALRRRLWWMPLQLANPAWVDAQPDLDRHIVEIRLPKGSQLKDLEQMVGKLHPVLLDRSRPLWKFHVLEGLAPGEDGRKRVALYTQLHHAAVDGQAAVALASVLLDVTETPRDVAAKASARPKRYRLGLAEMLSGAIANQVHQLSHLVRTLPATVGTLSKAAKQAAARSRFVTGRKGVGNFTLAPRTPLNVTVTDERAFAAVGVPLDELRAIGKEQEATLNDMVLMLCSTALRRYLARHHALPRKSLIAAVPVSLRQSGDTKSDNQASIAPVSLGTHIADPLKRLHHIKQATAAMKASMGSVKSILPTDFPSVGLPWLMEAATRLYGKARVADRLPQLANVAISNVPGPNVPLYLAGARMLTNYPTSVVVHGLALNITVQSYDQSLDFGLMADAKAVPDLRLIADSIAVAFDDLRALASESDEAAASAAEPSVAKSARKALGRAVDSAVDTATGLMTTSVGRMARAVNKRAAGIAADVVPVLAKRAVGQTVVGLSRLAHGPARLVRKATPRARAAARR